MHRQLLLILLGQLAEPIVASVLYPFINQLISELGITNGDDRKIGYYAGFIESLFFFAEFTMIFRWGRLSDRIGRKPVMLYGLAGMTVSSLCFGISKSYFALVVSRALNGALSGNIGVMKSAICEVMDERTMAEGFALLPVVWSLGNVIGPLLGGYLSKPQEKSPSIFSAPFWREYPYFLPCACAAVFPLVAILLIGIYFEECLPSIQKKKLKSREERDHVRLSALSPLEPSAFHIPEEEEEVPLVSSKPASQPSIRELLTPAVTIAIVNYATLSLLDIARVALLPLFYATPIEAGGLGLGPKAIGLLLGGYGIFNGVIQVLFGVRAQRRFGAKNVYTFSLVSYVGIFASFPLMSMLARSAGIQHPLLWFILVLQLILSSTGDTGFGCIFVFITSAAEKSQLGATNGIGQSVGSLMRSIGPACATSLFAVTQETNLADGTFIYLIFIVLAVASIAMAVKLPARIAHTI